MKIFFDLTSADVYMSKTGAGSFTLTAQLSGLWHEFKQETNDARLFDSFGDDDPDSVEIVTDAVRNLITDTLLDSQVDVGQMKGFFIGDSLWLPTPPVKQMWESGMPLSGYFRWGNDEYWLTPVSYSVCTDDEDGMVWVEDGFSSFSEAERLADTDPSYRVVRYAHIELPTIF